MAASAVLNLWLCGLLFCGSGAAAAQITPNATNATNAPNAPSVQTLPRFSVEQLLDAAQSQLSNPSSASSPVSRLVRLSAPEGVVLLQFTDLREQARAMARMVLFVEKAGAPRHRVMTVPEVLQWVRARGTRLELITWGNNLSADELSRFFNTARLQGEALTEQERVLLEDLQAAGLLRELDGGWAPGGAGPAVALAPAHTLLTVPRVSQVSACPACEVTPAMQRAILEHELGHGEFAASAFVQHHARWFWFNVLSPVARSQWQRFLTQRGYDTSQLHIVLGEMHAYLAHTHATTLFRAEELDLAPVALEALRVRYRNGHLAPPVPRVDPGYQLP